MQRGTYIIIENFYKILELDQYYKEKRYKQKSMMKF